MEVGLCNKNLKIVTLALGPGGEQKQEGPQEYC